MALTVKLPKHGFPRGEIQFKWRETLVQVSRSLALKSLALRFQLPKYCHVSWYLRLVSGEACQPTENP